MKHKYIREYYPQHGADLLKIITQAKENGLRIKCYGGTFPQNSSSADILVSLQNMKRMVWHDPENCTLTVEPGLTMSDLLKYLEYLNFTIELYGIIPDMSISDAVAVGLIGSNSNISNCVQESQVLLANGTIEECEWINGLENDSIKRPTIFPTLHSIVCGLGLIGTPTNITIKCIANHYAQEVAYSCSTDEFLSETGTLSKALYSLTYFYPLLEKGIIVNHHSVRLRQGYFQPVWKKVSENIILNIQKYIQVIFPFASWVTPFLAHSLSYLHFKLSELALHFRRHYCFPAQKIVPVKSYCKGTLWLLPLEQLPLVVKNLTLWAKEHYFICTSPLIIAMQTNNNTDSLLPYLSPYTNKETFTIWSNWFSAQSLSSSYSAPMAEFETILQENRGRKCWSAGPVYVSPLIGQMYPGYRKWCEALDASEGSQDIVQLRHPQSGASAMFLFSAGDGMVQEVLTLSENRRSWFIEDTVKSDGKMHLSTPIDPIFLVLPYLKKAAQAIPLDQLLKDDEFPETERLLKSTGLKHLNQVADKKGEEELNAFKYNEEKALNWLQRKTERVAEVLKQKGVHVSGGAVSATFVKSSKNESGDTESYLKYAHGIISEYLPEDLSLKLSKHMGLPEDRPPDNQNKRKLTVAQQGGETKKVKQEEVANGGVLDLTKPEKAAKTSITAKDKSRAKAASGSKNISSFFKKK